MADKNKKNNIDKIKENLQQFFIIWGFVLVLNQIFIFGACFAPYCLIAALPHTGVIAFFLTLYSLKSEDVSESTKEYEKKHREEVIRNIVNSTNQKEKSIFTEQTKFEDKYTQMGDDYEKYIGQQFERKGDLVIYNGLIFGLEDEGVDIISISSNEKYINLIQCKNWYKKQMTLENLELVYLKLEKYQLEFSIFHFDDEKINSYLIQKRPLFKINSILDNCKDFIFRKTLYIASDKVMDLEIGKELKLIKSNIFQYKDMKIVFKEIDN